MKEIYLFFNRYLPEHTCTNFETIHNNKNQITLSSTSFEIKESLRPITDVLRPLLDDPLMDKYFERAINVDFGIVDENDFDIPEAYLGQYYLKSHAPLFRNIDNKIFGTGNLFYDRERENPRL